MMADYVENLKAEWESLLIYDVTRTYVSRDSVYTAFAALRAEQTRLREALEKIQDGHSSVACECDHDGENCCAKIGEYCAICIAAVALSSTPTPEHSK